MNKKIEILKENEIVNISVNTNIFIRLNQLIYDLFVSGKDNKEFLNALEKISKNDPGIESDKYTYHLVTLLALQTAIENASREQGKTSEIDINLDVNEAKQS